MTQPQSYDDLGLMDRHDFKKVQRVARREAEAAEKAARKNGEPVAKVRSDHYQFLLSVKPEVANLALEELRSEGWTASARGFQDSRWFELEKTL